MIVGGHVWFRFDITRWSEHGEVRKGLQLPAARVVPPRRCVPPGVDPHTLLWLVQFRTFQDVADVVSEYLYHQLHRYGFGLESML